MQCSQVLEIRTSVLEIIFQFLNKSNSCVSSLDSDFIRTLATHCQDCSPSPSTYEIQTQEGSNQGPLNEWTEILAVSQRMSFFPTKSQGTLCALSPTTSISRAAIPLLHSWEVLQPNIDHIQTVTVIKAKSGHESKCNEGSLEGLGVIKERREIK